MKTIRFPIDRFAFLGLAVLASMPFMAIAPAMAGPAECRVEAEAIRAAAAGAEPQRAARALRNASLGERICAEGNPREAGRKFAAARQQLDGSVQLAAQR